VADDNRRCEVEQDRTLRELVALAPRVRQIEALLATCVESSGIACVHRLVIDLEPVDENANYQRLNVVCRQPLDFPR